jgi:hypothetical protein
MLAIRRVHSHRNVHRDRVSLVSDLSRRLDPPEPAVIMGKLPDLTSRIARTVKDRGVEHFLRHETAFSESADPDERNN